MFWCWCGIWFSSCCFVVVLFLDSYIPFVWVFCVFSSLTWISQYFVIFVDLLILPSFCGNSVCFLLPLLPLFVFACLCVFLCLFKILATAVWRIPKHNRIGNCIRTMGFVKMGASLYLFFCFVVVFALSIVCLLCFCLVIYSSVGFISCRFLFSSKLFSCWQLCGGESLPGIVLKFYYI